MFDENPYDKLEKKLETKIKGKQSEYDQIKAKLAETGLEYSDEDIRMLNASIKRSVLSVLGAKNDVEKAMALRKEIDELEIEKNAIYYQKDLKALSKYYKKANPVSTNIYLLASREKYEEAAEQLAANKDMVDAEFKAIIDVSIRFKRRPIHIFANYDIAQKFPDQIELIFGLSDYELEAFRQNPGAFGNKLENIATYKGYFDRFKNKKLPEEKIKKKLYVQEPEEEELIPGKIKYAYKILRQICGDDEEKKDAIVDLAEQKNGGYELYFFEVLARYKNLYGEDVEKLKQVVGSLKKIKTTWKNAAFTYAALEFLNITYKPTSIERLDTTCDAICELMKVNYDNSDFKWNEEIIHQYINTSSAYYYSKDGKRYSRAMEKYCVPEKPAREKLTIKYLQSGYPFHQDILDIYIKLGEKNENLEVDMEEFGEILANALLQKKEWYKEIFDLHQARTIRPFLPAWLQEFYGVTDQINTAALSVKLPEHFKELKIEKDDTAEKIALFKTYGEFLEEFNGTLVTTVWQLYYLLKSPADAAKRLTNIQQLNDTRAKENLETPDDLKKKIYDTKEGILLGNVSMDQYLDSGLKIAILDDMAKVSASEWKRENKPLSATLQTFKQDEPAIAATFQPNVYKSGFIPVKEFVEPLERDPALNENITRVQYAVRRFIKPETGQFFDEKEVAASLQIRIVQNLETTIQKAKLALQKGENAKGEKVEEKAKPFIQKAIDAQSNFLESIKKAQGFDELVHLLLDKKPKDIDCQAEICDIFYYLGARKQNLNDPNSWVYLMPNYIDGSKITEFINDTIFNEVVEGKSNNKKPDIALNSNEKKKLKTEFSGILKFLKEKEEQLEAYKKNAASNEKNIAVVAGRGILAELSGFYADACWTRQADILKNNPTMVGHTFVENFEEKEKSKIIGGCLSLESSITTVNPETSQEHKAKVIVARGLNPQNAYIKKYDVEMFVENFLDYLQEAGRKAKAEYIVVPLYQVGALSNRPEVIKYLSEKFKDGTRVSLDDSITFNGYEIKDACVVVRVVNQNERKEKKLPKPSNVPIENRSQWIASW